MIELRSKLSAFSDQSVGWALPTDRRRRCMVGGAHPTGFTLVEMLVAMAITLVMMAAVVTLFANVSNSVRNRRATIEMTNQLRSVRNTLQQDLQGATCPGVTWQRPESNHGYIELIEGIWNDQNPTALVNDLDGDGQPDLNPALSPIPRNNIGADGADGTIPNGEITAKELELHYKTVGSFVPGGLGDHDDVLMLTVRNEDEPFVGRTPTAHDQSGGLMSYAAWGYDTIESPLAEVVWFCVENPSESENPEKFFGEPGIRTIYRRTLLIAPWVNPYGANGDVTFDPGGGTFKAEPGLVRMLPSSIARVDVQRAIASIIAFQDKYDLSVRLEWDHNIGRWKIVANTLADLTKRENRFGHFGFSPDPLQRNYPFAFISTGSNYSGSNVDIVFETDPEMPDLPSGAGTAQWEANLVNKAVLSYSRKPHTPSGFSVRPFAFVEDAPDPGGFPAVASAMLNDEGEVVRVTLGPVPLWGTRRGQDVMMTEVLGFDLRVYDPGAPLFQHLATGTVLSPSDPGWRGSPPSGADGAYLHANNMGSANGIGSATTVFPYVGQGAYVDLGYGYDSRFTALSPPAFFPLPKYNLNVSVREPWFFSPRGLSDVFGNLLAPGYSVYDTWSFHYENNGIDEDNFSGVDQGTNGLDDMGQYANPTPPPLTLPDRRLGPDDVGERETVPPYDKPLRGVQVLIRTYELDSRAIRQVRVNQHFLPE